MYGESVLFVVLAVGVGREPASLHTLGLLLQLADAPQTGTSDDADDGGDHEIRDEQRDHQTCDPRNQKYRPALLTEVVFGLDHDGMENADAQESNDCKDDTVEIHKGPHFCWGPAFFLCMSQWQLMYDQTEPV